MFQRQTRHQVHHQQQAINAWLEQISEIDDGPRLKGLSAASAFHDAENEYETLGKSPF